MIPDGHGGVPLVPGERARRACDHGTHNTRYLWPFRSTSAQHQRVKGVKPLAPLGYAKQSLPYVPLAPIWGRGSG